MSRFRLVSVTLALAAALWPVPSDAQTPPPAPADEDLEVPASPPPTATPNDPVAEPTTSTAAAASAESEVRPAPAPASANAIAQTPPAPLTPAAPPAAVKAEPAPFLGLRFGGYLQAQYQRSDLSEDQLQQGGTPLNQNQFLVRRARLRVDRVWDHASAAVELDANTVRGPRVGIRRAEAALFFRGNNPESMPPLIALSVGVMDIPFGYELQESARVRWFTERSQGNLALFPTEPDLGARLAGAVSFFRYAVAVMNGQPLEEGALFRDPNDAKDGLARFGAEGDLGPGLQLSGGTSFAYGKGFHAGRDAGKSSLAWTDLNEDGTVQPTEVTGVPGSAASASENFQRWAIGLDLGVSLRTRWGVSRVYGEAFVSSNYDRGYSPSDPVSTRTDARQAGGYLALTQEIARYGMLGFRAAVYDPNSDLIEVQGGRTLPKTQTVKVFSPLVGVTLPGRARLLAQYDFIRDYQARDSAGVPTDAENNQLTVRLQVEL